MSHRPLESEPLLLNPSPKRTWKGGQKVTVLLSSTFVVTLSLAAIGYMYMISPESDSDLGLHHQVKDAGTPILRMNGGQLRQSNPTSNQSSSNFEIDVTQGTLRGKELVSRDGRKYLSFVRIPYAQPPIGNLRFMPPVKAEPWEGVRDAKVLGPPCIQKRSKNIEPHGFEDCLFLNVFTPKTMDELKPRDRTSWWARSPRNLFPVIFYIHGGGGGAEGDGIRYSGEYFMDEDVILVTVDYRLGVFGSLNLNITEASGNQGQKDQLMALQWVQDNIKTFGGDPSRVTLVGNSAGAHQVSAHMVSPLGQGLYHGGICQSGTVLLPGYLSGTPVEDAYLLGDKLNCSSLKSNNGSRSSPHDLLSCFKDTPAPTLVLSSIHLRHRFTFTFSVDLGAEEGSRFLPEPPLALFQSGNLKKLPFMTGVTDAEGLPQSLEILNRPDKFIGFNRSDWSSSDIVINQLQLLLSAQDSGSLTSHIQNYYFENGTSQGLGLENLPELTDMFSDRLFNHPIYTMTKFQVERNGNSTGADGLFPFRGRGQSFGGKDPGVYLYIFSHEINMSRCYGSEFRADEWGLQDFGLCHADELQFFFPEGGTGNIYPPIPKDHPYADFSRMVIRLWTSFAKSGKPKVLEGDEPWSPLEKKPPFKAYHLNDVPFMVTFFQERMEFWDQFNLTDLYR